MANLFGIGGSSLIARYLGTQDFERARQTSAFSVWGGISLGMIYSILLFFLSGTFLHLPEAGESTFEYCYSYMFWTCVIGGLPTIMNPWDLPFCDQIPTDVLTIGIPSSSAVS